MPASPAFENCDAGVGDLSVDGTLCGFMEKATATKGSESLDLRTGTPKQLRGRIPINRSHILKASLYETSMDNISMFAGTEQAVTIAGSPVTRTMQAQTFYTPTGATIQQIRLDGLGLSSVTVKNSAETTTYTINTDYLINAAAGIIYRNPGGTIGASAVVHVTYTYAPPASKRLNLGAAASIVYYTLNNVQFTHPSPTNPGKIRTIFMHKAQCKGQIELTFEDEKYQLLEPEIEAIDDSANHPDDPFGYWDWQE